MSSEIFGRLKVLDIYAENDYQKILICSDKNNDEKFLVNAILNKNPIVPINLKKLNDKTNIFCEIKESEDILYLISKYYDNTYLEEYVKHNKLKLSRQINYATAILDRLMELKSFPPYIINSLLSKNNIYIDEKNRIHVSGLGLLVLNEYYNIEEIDVFKTISKLFKIIFGGKEYLNNKSITSIPPDIQKIIHKCESYDYEKYEDIVKDFKNSKLYKLINPEMEELERTHLMRKKLTSQKRKFKIKRVFILIALIAVITFPFIMNKGISFFNSIEWNTELSSDTISNSDDKNITNQNSQNEFNENDISNDDADLKIEEERENLHYYFNDWLLELGNNDIVGEIDTSVYYKGNSSIKANNDKEKKEFLIGGINLNNDHFNYLKSRDVDVLLWLNSKKGQDAAISLKLYNKEKLLSKVTKKVFIPKGTWTLYNLNMKTGKGEYIKIHLTLYEEGEVWIDNFDVDILK